jgi:hypothetical protein
MPIQPQLLPNSNLEREAQISLQQQLMAKKSLLLPQQRKVLMQRKSKNLLLKQLTQNNLQGKKNLNKKMKRSKQNLQRELKISSKRRRELKLTLSKVLLMDLFKTLPNLEQRRNKYRRHSLPWKKNLKMINLNGKLNNKRERASLPRPFSRPNSIQRAVAKNLFTFQGVSMPQARQISNTPSASSRLFLCK